jgi:hypothetical protein
MGRLKYLAWEARPTLGRKRQQKGQEEWEPLLTMSETIVSVKPC